MQTMLIYIWRIYENIYVLLENLYYKIREVYYLSDFCLFNFRENVNTSLLFFLVYFLRVNMRSDGIENIRLEIIQA